MCYHNENSKIDNMHKITHKLESTVTLGLCQAQLWWVICTLWEKPVRCAEQISFLWCYHLSQTMGNSAWDGAFSYFTALWSWLEEKESICFDCIHISQNMEWYSFYAHNLHKLLFGFMMSYFLVVLSKGVMSIKRRDVCTSVEGKL